MKNMTLGAKIALGFGLLIVLAMILGGIGVFNMNKAQDNAATLSDKYVPEIRVANKIERNSLEAVSGLQLYELNSDEDALARAKTSLKKVHEGLDDARLLAEKQNLSALKQLEAQARKNVNSYEELLAELESLKNEEQVVFGRMDAAGDNFMKNTAIYLDSQNEKFDRLVESGIYSAAELQDRHEKITLINDVIDLGNEIRINNFKSEARNNEQFIQDGLARFPEMEKKLERLNEISVDPDDIAALKNIQEAAENYEKAINHDLDIEHSINDLNKKRATTRDEVISSAQEAAALGMNNTVDKADEAQNALASASMTMLIGLVAALVIGILLAIFIIRSITKPVVAAVQTISEANSQVVSASDQIASSSQSLAEGASEQASSVEEVTATVEESTASNNQNAENSKEADTLAKATNSAAETGNHKVKELMSSMENITESSQKIAKIIKTIDEIAFQTNLLALNAAVEAARAGEHGLGFAVVADEVKNLAQRSADAAKETAGIIEEAIEQIKSGNQIAKDTNDSFGSILDNAKKTSDLIGEITASVREQAEGMNQISTAMGQVDQVTQQNAANSEEAAASAQELNAQAESMRKSVQEIARIVGLSVEDEQSSPGSRKQLPRSSSQHKEQEKKHKALDHKPKSRPKKEQKKEENDHDDVFPLDEDDMREF